MAVRLSTLSVGTEPLGEKPCAPLDLGSIRNGCGRRDKTDTVSVTQRPYAHFMGLPTDCLTRQPPSPAQANLESGVLKRVGRDYAITVS